MYSDVFWGMSLPATSTASGIGGTMTHPVALYENTDGHLLDKIPRTQVFLMFQNGLQSTKYSYLEVNFTQV